MSSVPFWINWGVFVILVLFHTKGLEADPGPPQLLYFSLFSWRCRRMYLSASACSALISLLFSVACQSPFVKLISNAMLAVGLPQSPASRSSLNPPNTFFLMPLATDCLVLLLSVCFPYLLHMFWSPFPGQLLCDRPCSRFWKWRWLSPRESHFLLTFLSW